MPRAEWDFETALKHLKLGIPVRRAKWAPTWRVVLNESPVSDVALEWRYSCSMRGQIATHDPIRHHEWHWTIMPGDLFMSDWQLYEEPERVRQFRLYQQCDWVHACTCGNKSSHRPLVSDDGENMYCLDCKYTQSHIPEMIFSENMQQYILTHPFEGAL